MSRRILALSILSVTSVFSGCIETTGIIKTDDNTYLLRSQDSRYYATSGARLKESLYVDAKKLCDKQGKKMVLLNEFAKDNQPGASALAEIQFQCQ